MQVTKRIELAVGYAEGIAVPVNPGRRAELAELRRRRAQCRTSRCMRRPEAGRA